MVLGKRIKEVRKSRDLTQDDLAQMIGVSKVTICYWEKEIKKPSTKNLILLSKKLNTPVEYLIGNDEYVVSESDNNYGLMMTNEEIDLINELRNHENLYRVLVENPKRTCERIEKNLF